MNQQERLGFEAHVRQRYGSFRAFAKHAGISIETLFALRRGSNLSPHVIEKVNNALGGEHRIT
jgi:hypothetical protein